MNSTAESGRPDLDFKMNKRLKNQLEEEIYVYDDYTTKQLPAVMTCAGEYKLE